MATSSPAARPLALVLSLAVTTLLLHPDYSDASIITNGAVTEIATPVSVDLGDLESNVDVFAFVERPGVALQNDIAVDITSPETVTSAALPISSGTIVSGTIVDSYFLHFDTFGSTFRLVSGSVSFDTEVLGVILSASLLDDSDADLGATGTSYPFGLAIGSITDVRGTATFGVEHPLHDAVTLSADRKTVSITMGVDAGVDQVRIITQPSSSAVIPEPTSAVVWAFLVGLTVFHGVRKRSPRLPRRTTN